MVARVAVGSGSARATAPPGAASRSSDRALGRGNDRRKETRRGPGPDDRGKLQDEAPVRTDEAAEASRPYVHAKGPVLWKSYDRREIPPLFGAEFNEGSWNAGIVRLDHRLILLTTLRKGSLSAGNHYEDAFLDDRTIQWQSQSRTRQDSRHGAMISGRESSAEVHMFVRAGKLREGRAAPFVYCGRVSFLGWEGEQPITVRFGLPEPVPAHLRRSFAVPS